MQNCNAINDMIQDFCAKFGQKVSATKTSVFFSPNVDSDLKDNLTNLLVFDSMTNLGKYLGFPLKHPGTWKLDFDFVLDQVKKKIAGWKANLLSMVGRMVLVQASSSAIPSYVMHYTFLPNKILDGIDRVNRNFLWGSNDHARKMHWVNWDVVTKPKEAGGLGLQSAKGRNTALLANLNWRFHLEKSSMWAKVLKFKYCTQQRINSRNAARLPSSSTWKGLKKEEDIFRQGIKWLLGYNSSLSFWKDC